MVLEFCIELILGKGKSDFREWRGGGWMRVPMLHIDYKKW